MSETSVIAVDSAPVRPVISVPPRRSIARNVVSLLLGQMGTMAISIVISAVIGRFLGAASLGTLYLVMASVNFAGIFVEWGQQGYLVAEVAKFRERSGELLGTALVARLVLAVVSYSLAVACARLLGHGPEVRSLLVLMAVCVIPGNLATTLAQGFRGHDRMDLAGVALSPTLARFAGDLSALRSKARDALRLVLMLGALAAAGTALYADVAVALVFRREGFEPAIVVLRALAPYLFLMFVNILLGSAILAIGRARAAFTAAKFVALTVGGLLDLILIPYFEARYGNGGIGLAVSLTVAELVMTVAALRLAPDGIIERGHWRLAGAALVSAAAMLVAGALLRNAPLPVRFVVPLIVFAVAIRATGLFTVADGRRIWEAARLRSEASRA